MILLGLQFGGATFPWRSPQVLCLVIFGSLFSIFFIFSEKRLARYPIMPLELFKKKTNVAALLLAFTNGMVSIKVLSFFLCTDYTPGLYRRRILSSPLLSVCPFRLTFSVRCACSPHNLHPSHRGHLCWRLHVSIPLF